jgi:type I restriction enzyme M protein
VVLPDGFLFGEGIKSRIKEKLLTECNLHTIVRLPNGVFNPYTGIKTNLLFFTKGRPTRDVWFYEHQYPAGVKNYSKTRPMRIEEFEVEEAWWGRRAADGFAWNLDCEPACGRAGESRCRGTLSEELVARCDPPARNHYSRSAFGDGRRAVGWGRGYWATTAKNLRRLQEPKVAFS